MTKNRWMAAHRSCDFIRHADWPIPTFNALLWMVSTTVAGALASGEAPTVRSLAGLQRPFGASRDPQPM